MNLQSLLQVASTFACAPIEPSLRRALVSPDGVQGLAFARYTQVSEYLLSPAANSPQTLGTLVLLRLEDWLREELESPPSGMSRDAWIRQQLRIRADEFVSQLTLLSENGKLVWFMACPSTGWIAEGQKLSTLLRTYTNLIATRVRNLSQVISLNWPSSLTVGQYEDPSTDQLEQLPCNQIAFDQFGEFLASQIAQTLAARDTRASSHTSSGSPALAAYLAGLNLEVQLAQAQPSDRVHVDRILRATASFSLAGEQPDISESELDALLAAHTCLLITVSDRLASYGPSGVVLFRTTEEALFVEGLALSCTVLGKQVEYAVLTALSEIATHDCVAHVVFHYIPTKRNQSMLTFLQTIADAQSDASYVFPIRVAVSRISAAAVCVGAWTVTQKLDQASELVKP